MTREEAKAEINKVFEPAFANYIITALTEGATWIPVSKRLPNLEEYIENNGIFNVSDGYRSYFEYFDIYDKQMFGEPTMSGFRVDYAVTAWQPLPDPYVPEINVGNMAENEE